MPSSRCGGPGTYADRVIDFVAKIGVRGLRMEHWLDHPDPSSAQYPVAPLLEPTGLSEQTQQSLRAAASAIMQDLAGRGPRNADPRFVS